VSVKTMKDRHPHAHGAKVTAAGAHQGHPHAVRVAENPASPAPPVQAPAESAAEQYKAIAEVTADWAYALHIEADGRAITDWMSPDVQQVSGFTPSELGAVDAWLRGHTSGRCRPGARIRWNTGSRPGLARHAGCATMRDRWPARYTELFRSSVG
jgi:hypothetical protein